MKVLLAILMLALAAVAIPSASAALPIQCTYGPTSPGGDTHCEGDVAKCDVLVHMYDQEDALNHYKVACGCYAYDNYGRPALRLCDLIGPLTPAPALAAAVPDLFETHCVSDDTGVAHCSTTILGTCSYATVGGASSSLACWHTAFGYCSVSPTQNPPNLWCEDLQPPGDDSAAAIAPPALPCQSGIAGSWCTVGAFDCKATVGFQTGGQAYQYAGAYCGPDLWYPCVIVYADTRGNVESCLVATSPPPIATSTAAADPAQICTAGFAQTWCDVTVGPCDVRVTPWTAWGDQYVVSDCRTGGAGPTCHTEVHTEGPLAHEHWCAF